MKKNDDKQHTITITFNEAMEYQFFFLVNKTELRNTNISKTCRRGRDNEGKYNEKQSGELTRLRLSISIEIDRGIKVVMIFS